MKSMEVLPLFRNEVPGKHFHQRFPICGIALTIVATTQNKFTVMKTNYTIFFPFASLS
jgi:hypothetical protein